MIVGSRAVHEAGWLHRLIETLGSEAVIGSLDLRNGRVAIEGWKKIAEGEAPDAVWDAWIGAGLARAIVTDTTRDGTMEGVRPGSYGPFLGGPVAVAAAGGVAGPADLDALAASGLDAAVAGRALYDGGLDVDRLSERGWRWDATVDSSTTVGRSTNPDEGGA